MQTKHGNVNTDHILFICSGAFHSCKPSDLMAELQVSPVLWPRLRLGEEALINPGGALFVAQGRLPIRVELKALTQHDFYRILTEPQYNLIKQQQVRCRVPALAPLCTNTSRSTILPSAPSGQQPTLLIVCFFR